MYKKNLIYFFIFILSVYSFYTFIINILPFLTPIRPYILIICDLSLFLLPVLSNAYYKQNFINYILIIFLCTSSITFLLNINHVDLLTHINGLREFFVVFSSLIYIRHIMRSEYAHILHKLMIGFIFLFLIAQIPISIMQYLKYGASDFVGGSIGYGGSGTITLFIYLGCFFLMANNAFKNNFRNFNFYYLIILIPFFIPSFINETKITFFLLFLFFFFLIRLKVRDFFSIIIIISSFYLIFNFFSATYIKTTKFESIDQIASTEYLKNYLYKEDEKNTMSRFTRIKSAYNIINQDVLSLLFGKGIGILKGGNILHQTEISLKYNWLLSGTRSYILYLMIQGGLINGIIMLITILYPFFSYMIYTKKKYNKFVINKLNIFLFITAILIFIYSDVFRSGQFTCFFSYISLYILFSYNIYRSNFDRRTLTNNVISQ